MTNKKTPIIAVDFQKAFTTPEGEWFNPGESVNFIKTTVIPFLLENNIKLAEIISDYRQPRPGDRGDGCAPGTVDYQSEIPKVVKSEDIWIKSMNSPLWIRENAGVAEAEPGLPYQAPEKFSAWLKNNIGEPKELEFVALIGLTLDCCVFCTAQELCFRGYKVKIIEEATDPVGGEKEYKEQLITKSPLLNWAGIIKWEEFKNIINY